MRKRVLVTISLFAILMLAGDTMAYLNLLPDAGFEDDGDVGASYKYLGDPTYAGYWLQESGSCYLVQSPGWVNLGFDSEGNMMQLSNSSIYNWIGGSGTIKEGAEYTITMDVASNPGNAVNIQIGQQAMSATTMTVGDWEQLAWKWIPTSADLASGDGSQTLFHVQSDDGIWIDNMFMGRLDQASEPIPNDGNNIVAPTTTTLVWTLPAPRNPGDSLSAEVYFDTVEQNVVDGSAGSMILSKTSGATTATVSLSPNTEYFWRVDVYDPNSPDGPEIKAEGLVWHFSTQSQLATSPVPADGAVNVSIAPELDWFAGLGATAHTIYGPSTDQTAVINGTASSAVVNPPYNPAGNNALNTEYFWRIDENNGSGAGTVWSYTTSGWDYIEEIGEDFDANDFVSSPDVGLATVDGGWVAMPLDEAAAQSYTRTFDEAIDATSAAYMFFDYWQDESDTDIVPDITVKLLDTADAIVVEETLTEFEASTIATSRVELLTAGPGNLAEVKKIVVEIPSSSCASETTFKMYGFGISVATCDTPPTYDVNGDCLITMTDFAAFVQTWMECGLFPASSCP